MSSLDDFARESGRRRMPRWVDSLPDDVRAQIVASDASATVVTRWLHSLGFDEATAARVKPLIDERDRE